MEKVMLLIHCKDATGIIAAVTNFIYQQKGNIVYIDQHVDSENGTFFMRLESVFEHTSFAYSTFKKEFSEAIAGTYEMEWQLFPSDYKPKMAVFVSKYDHCLYDILSRYNAGEWEVEIPLIISNHPDLATAAKNFGIPYYHIPVTKETKGEAEALQIELLQKFEIDFIVLARYMQIVSEKIIDLYPNRIINIHHSFLPAFVGAKPYHSAYKRGVKIIGATSHYVTEELDAGPIIEQDVARVTHTHDIKDLVMKGKDLEKIVLSRAIKLHIERKTIVYNNKTIIFS
ncbi:formyltetrahydrofolate deformylase [Pustulibacterium marinum]|uniref:Formyltetrahydrofolate deformylase n=1 Tax=Pustulibacterium marinum TaxID=1224947 RepID=A0A1I7FAL3_9FLAO|nr:formyltetrahydrofolate deformylase [Pustulibacterium marinum]SFU33293.1 formyltetrahydrofolate deformylase [Pustulibacterium marinum]